MKITENFRDSQGVKLIPLGGLNEIGKNLTVLEYKNDILIIDCGLSFPDDEMFGIDIVIPDFSYLEKNREKLRGMVLTHGHEDHIGAIPYLLKSVNVPIYGTKLTLGLVENKLKEHGLKAKLNTIKSGQTFKVGEIKIEAIRTTHSIADSICLAIDTPAGVIFHTGDFKIDYTPLHGKPIDFQRLAKIGEKGVLLMIADSTNAERKGYTPSESTVGIALENIFRNCTNRIIIATFSSNVHRVQRIIDTAVMFNRKVAISGRSMINVVNIAKDIGYLKIPDKTLVDINKAKNIKDSELVIITTGSQGEPMSALTRMANNDHRKIQIKPGDLVIISANPIPGNEITVSNVINTLYEKGARVLYDALTQVHVSGHARRDELKLMLSLLKPKFFIPVHGEYRHLVQHANLANELGMPMENTMIGNNGDVIELTSKSMVKNGTVTSGNILVDGLGVGDVGNIVLRDRKLLSENGLIIVVLSTERGRGRVLAGPEIVSRGFVYVRENIDLIEESKTVVRKALEKCEDTNVKEWNNIKMIIKDSLSSFIYDKIKRSPMILPIIVEVDLES